MTITPRKNTNHPAMRTLLAFSAILLLRGTAGAATFTWNSQGPANGAADTFGSSTDWLGGVIPVSGSATTVVFIPTGGTFTNTGTYNNFINLSSNFTLNTLTLGGVGSSSANSNVTINFKSQQLIWAVNSGTGPTLNLNTTNGTSTVTYVNGGQPWVLQGNLTIQGTGNTTFNMGSVISSSGGAFGLIMNATNSVFSLAGNNATYTGATTINSGTIVITGSGNLGPASATNVLNLGGGSLDSTANTYTIFQATTLTASGSSIIQADAGTLTMSGSFGGVAGSVLVLQGTGGIIISGTMGGSEGVTVIGSGTKQLINAVNTYSGMTTVNSGATLLVTGTGSLGTLGGSGLVMNGGTFGFISGSNTLGGSITLSGSSAFTAVNATDNIVLSGTLSGTSAIFEGSGTSTVSGAIVSSSNLALIASGPLTRISGTVSLAGNILNISGTGLLTVSGAVAGPGTSDLTVNVAGPGLTNISGTIANGGGFGLVKGGTGILELTSGAINGYSGNTTITAGTLLVTGTNDLGTLGAAGLVLNGGTFGFMSGANVLANNFALGAPGSGFTSVSTADSLTLSGTLSGSNLAVTGSGATAITNTIVAPGTGNFTLSVVGTGTTSLSGTLTNGAGFGLTKTGAGVLSLTGSAVNNYASGTTNIAAGILNLGNQFALAGSGTAITFTGGVLQYSGNSQVDYSADIVGSGSAVAIDVNGQTVTFNNPLVSSNTGGLKVLGTGGGTLILNAANNYSGTTTLAGGTINLALATSLPAGSTLTFTGGTLQYSVNNQVDFSSRIANSTGVVKIDVNGQTITLATGLAVSNTGGLTLLDSAGGGMLTLTGVNLYTGTTTVANDTLVLTSGASLSPLTPFVLGSSSGTTSGTFQLGSAGGAVNQTLAGISVAAGAGTANAVVGGNTTISGTLTISPSGADTYSGVIGGTNTTQNNLVLVMAGSGNLALTGTNTYTGSTFINSGALLVNSGSNLGSQGFAGIVFNGGLFGFVSGTNTLSNNYTFSVAGSGFSAANATDLLALTGTLSGPAVAFGGSGTTSVTNAIVGTGAAPLTISVIGTGVTLVSGSIGNGSANVVKSGPGLLVLTSAQTYTGTTIVGNGILAVGPGGSVNTGTLVLGAAGTSGTFQVGSASGAQNATFAGVLVGSGATGGVIVGGNSLTGTFTVNASGSDAYTGTIGAGGSNQNNVALLMEGGGNFMLSAANTFTGGLTVESGTVSAVGNVAAFGASTNLITLGDSNTSSGGAAIIGGSSNPTYSNPITTTVASGTNQLIIGNLSGLAATFSGSLALGNNITVDATGAITNISGSKLTGTGNFITNSFSGGEVEISQSGSGQGWTGNLIVNSGSAETTGNQFMGTANTIQVNSGAFFYFTGGWNTPFGGITGSGSSSITSNFTLGGPGFYLYTGTFNQSGGTWFHYNSGTQEYTGPTTFPGGGGQVNGGELILSSANNGSMTGTATLSVGTGQTVTGSTGQATLLITSGSAGGNYTITETTGNGINIKNGSASSGTAGGTLSLSDGAINTLTINSTSSAATILQFQSAAGVPSNLVMDIGNGTSDLILAAQSGEKVTLPATVMVTLNGIGGFTSSGTSILINIPANGNTLAVPLLATTGNFGGVTSVTLVVVGTGTLEATWSAPIASPAVAYWKGGQGTTWNTLTGGTSNLSNWSSDTNGFIQTQQLPGAVTDVNFSAINSSNYTTTLGANFSIKGLFFTGAGGAVTIGDTAHTLTVGTDGINDSPGAAAVLISTNVTNSGSWVNNSAAALTVTGTIGGSAGISTAGSGTIALDGNDTFTGGLTIAGGVVQLGNSGALNSSTPQSVTFGAGVTSATQLQLNGQNVTIGSLATNPSTPGSPMVEDGSSTASLLIVSQTTSTTYAGVLQDGGAGSLSFTLAGSGTLALTGANTYSGSTTVNGGNLQIFGSLSSSPTVVVNNTGMLSGTGTVHGAVTIQNGGAIAVGAASPGTLTLGNGLTINSGGIAYFNIINGGANDEIKITGGLTLASGAIIRVPVTLTTSGTYDLFTYTTGPDPNLISGGILEQNTSGGQLGGNFQFVASGGTLELIITPPTMAFPSLTITTPASGARVMAGTTVAIQGVVTNSGPIQLNGTFSDSGLNLAVTGFNQSSGTVAPNSSGTYGAAVATGATLGSRSYGITITDGSASPTSNNASSTLTVLTNRVVSANTSPNFGVVHQGSTVSATIVLSSTGADNNFTRVTVADSGTDANGIAITGGTLPVFNGSTSDTRSVGGVITTLGTVSGTITLLTGSEGLAGEAPINVPVNYSAQVFSGTAQWAVNANSSWGTNSNWADTSSSDPGGQGAPGLAGAASINDVAIFNNASGQSGVLTVTLDNSNPTLAGITFNSTLGYTIATGSGGTLTLLGAATPISVVTGTDTISAVLAGNGFSKSGTGTLILAGANTYTGSTTISNGIVQITAAALPNSTILTEGDISNDGGQLVLGNSGTAQSPTVAGLQTVGTGTNSIVGGGATGFSSLTLRGASGASYTYGGVIGGIGLNQNNISVSISGAGFLQTFTGTSTYSGPTITGSANNSGTIGIGAGETFTSGTILFGGAIGTGTLDLNNTGTIIAVGGARSVDNVIMLTGGGNTTVGGSNALIFNQTAGFLDLNGNETLTNNDTGGLTLAGGVYLNNFSNPSAIIFKGTGITTISGSVGANAASSGATLGLQLQGTPQLILSNPNNTYSGDTQVQSGTLVLAASSTGLPGAVTNGPIGVSILQLQGGTVMAGTNAPQTISNSGSLASSSAIGGGSNLTLNGVITGGSGSNLTIIGPNATILTATETYVGATIINSGTLQLGDGTSGHDGSIASSSGVTDNGTLAFDRFANDIYSGNIAGSGGVSVAGSGTETLTGSLGYTGVTTITAATLQLGNGTITPTLASGTINDNGALIFTTSGSQNFAGSITGAGSVSMTGSGNQILSGSNSYTGSTLVTTGTLQLANSAALGNTSSLTISGSGSVNLFNGLTPHVITLSGPSGTTLTVNDGSSLSFGIGTGAQDEIVLQPGANVSVNGTITINLSLYSSIGSGTNLVTIISAPGATGLGLNAASFVLGTTPSLSSASITQSGTSVMVSLSLPIPTVYWFGGNSPSNSWVTSTPGANWTADAAGTQPVVDGSGAPAMFGSSQDVVFSGTGTGSNAPENQGNTVLGGPVSAHSLTISDPTSVKIGDNGGSDVLTLAGIFGTTGINISATAGTDPSQGGQPSITANVLFSGSSNVTVNNPLGLLMTGAISGSNGLVVNGTTMLTLNTSNLNPSTYTGGTTLVSGTLNFNSDGDLGATSSGVTFNPGVGNSVTLQSGTLQSSGIVPLGSPSRSFVFASGTGIIDTPAGSILNLGGIISGTAALNKEDTGELIFSGIVNFNGTATVTTGTLDLTSPGTLAQTGTSTFVTAPGGTLELGAIIPGNLAPATGGAVTFTGNGNLLIAGASNFQMHGGNGGGNIYMDMTGGVIEVSGAGIIVQNGGTGGNGASGNSSLGTGSPLWTGTLASGSAFNNLASLQIDSGAEFDTWNGNPVVVDALLGSGTLTRLGFGINGQAPGSVTIGINNGSGTFAGTITNALGTNNITKTGTGVEVFSGSNSYTGATTITGSNGLGTLRIINSAGLGLNGQTFAAPTGGGQFTASVSGSGTLDLSGNMTVNKAITLNGGSLINSALGTTAVLDSGIAGITFTNDPNLAGAVIANINGGSGSGATATGGSMSGTTAPLAGGGANNLYVQMTAAGSGYTPSTAPTVSITQSGSATGVDTAVVSSLVLTGTNNFLGGSGNLTINAQISGVGGGFTQTGTGTLTLTGSNTFTGPTTVSSGTMVVNGSLVSNVTVNAGATLAGFGSVGKISGAGQVAPADAPSIMTAMQVDPQSNGNTSYTFSFTQLAPTYSNTSNSSNDVLRLTNGTPFVFSLTSANVVTIDFSGASLSGGQVYLGGFFTDAGVNTATAGTPTFNYVGNGGFSVQYLGMVNVPSANFGTGTVMNGTEMEFQIIPEPNTYAMIFCGFGMLIVFRKLRRTSSGAAARIRVMKSRKQ